MMSKQNQPYRQIKSMGLEALFGDSREQGESVPIEAIKLPLEQPRRYFDPQKMQQLVQSVKEHGILEPLLVRPLSSEVYELVAGERRLRAAKEVGLSEVPVVIRELSDEEALQLALIENLCREDLNPVEETEGILQLLALKLSLTQQAAVSLLRRMQNEVEGKVTHNVMRNEESQIVQEVFNGLGLMTWESFVKNRLPLLNLPEDVLAALRQGQIAYTKAKAIARLKEPDPRKELLRSAIAENLSLKEIQSRLKEHIQTDYPVERKERVETIYRRVKQARVWEDGEKWSRLEALLAEIEALVSSE